MVSTVFWPRSGIGAFASFIVIGGDCVFVGVAGAQTWASYGHDAQHSGQSTHPSLVPLNIRWQVPVDLAPQYASGGDLYTHYGSPAITAKNNVIVPIKTGPGGAFTVKAFQGSNGNQLWTLTTDYVLPSYNWIPPLGITLTPGDGAVAVAAAGGTVLWRKSPNSAGGAATRLAFFGISNYNQIPPHLMMLFRSARRLHAIRPAISISAMFPVVRPCRAIPVGLPAGWPRSRPVARVDSSPRRPCAATGTSSNAHTTALPASREMAAGFTLPLIRATTRMATSATSRSLH